MSDDENGIETPETPVIPEVPELDELLEFVKNLLGFYGAGGDSVLGPLILASKQYLRNAGVKVPVEPEVADPDNPTEEEQAALAAYEKEAALYNVAIATRVKILHDGDPKGDLERVLTSIILQIKDYAGGEVI